METISQYVRSLNELENLTRQQKFIIMLISLKTTFSNKIKTENMNNQFKNINIS